MGVLDKELRKLLSDLDSIPVSKALGRTMRLAHERGDEELARWCRLEVQGYEAGNPAMGEDITVPVYRTVVGQHQDIYGRVFLAPPELRIVNEDRLRMGAAELERLERNHKMVTVHNPTMVQLIKEHLDVDVYSFTFSAANITSILASIQTELSARLARLAPLSPVTREDVMTRAPDDILEIKPGLWGIHVNVRALWRRIRAS
jgi:AbiTii